MAYTPVPAGPLLTYLGRLDRGRQSPRVIYVPTGTTDFVVWGAYGSQRRALREAAALDDPILQVSAVVVPGATTGWLSIDR